MPKVDVELGPLEVRWGDNAGMVREFSAQVQRTGVYAGELLGSTRVIRVEFSDASGLPAVDIERWRGRDEDWDVDYLPILSDDREARKVVSGAVRTALMEGQQA